MENFNNTPKRSVDAPQASAPVSSPVASTSNPLKKVVIALVALLIVGVGTFAFLNLSKERPPELQLAGGESGLKGSFVETSQNLLQFEQYDKDAFAINKSSLAAKYSMAASTLPGVNYLFADSQISMADVVKGIDPVANRLLLAYYTPGEGNLTEGFYTYPKGPFNATHEISQAALTSFMIPQNRVVVVISEMAASSYGLLNGTSKPSAMWASAPLADTNSGWVLVASKEASLAALTASYKDRVISAFALNGQETFQQVDPATYSLSSNSVVWLHLRPKATITGGTTGGTETVVLTPSLTMQTGLTLKAGDQLAVNLVGANLTGGVTVTDPSADSKLVISGKKVGADGKSFAFIVNALDSAPAATPFNLTITTADNVAHIQPITVTAKPVDGTLAPLVFTEPTANGTIKLESITTAGLHFTATNPNDVTKSTLVGTNGTHYFGYRWVLTNDANTSVWGTPKNWTESAKFPVGTSDCVVNLPLAGISNDVWTCASGSIPLSAFQGTTKDAIYTLTGAAYDGKTTTVDSSIKFTVTVPVAAPGTLNAPTGLAPNSTTAAVDLTKNLSLTWAAPQSTGTVSYVWKLAKGKLDATQFATTPNTLWQLTKEYSATTGGVNEQDAICYVGRKWSCTNLTIGQDLRTKMATTPGDFTWGVQAYTSGTTPLTSAWSTAQFTTAAAVLSTDTIGSEVLALAPAKDTKPGYTGTYDGTEYQWFKGKILNIGTLHDIKLLEGPKKDTMVYLTKNHTALLNTPASLVADQKVISKGRNATGGPDSNFWSAHIISVNADGTYTYGYDHEWNAGTNTYAVNEKRTIDNFFVPLSGAEVEKLVATGASGITKKTDTTTPSKIVFTAPIEGAEYALADLQKSGLDFIATDANKTSFNLASDGQYYMGYTWTLTNEDGKVTYWDSTKTGAVSSTTPGSLPLYLDASKNSAIVSPLFQSNINLGTILKLTGGASVLGDMGAVRNVSQSAGFSRINVINSDLQNALFVAMNTCTKTVSDKSMWVCPNGTIPKKFFTTMTEGTKLILTGTVSDGTKSATQTVKFSVKGGAGANGISENKDDTALSPIAILSPTSSKTVALSELQNKGLAVVVDDQNKLSYNKGTDGNFYMNYAWGLTNTTQNTQLVEYMGWRGPYDKFNSAYGNDKNCERNLEGINDGTVWTCPGALILKDVFKDVKSGDKLKLSVSSGDGNNGTDATTEFTVSDVAGDAEKGEILVNVQPYAIRPDTGDAIFRFNFDVKGLKSKGMYEGKNIYVGISLVDSDKPDAKELYKLTPVLSDTLTDISNGHEDPIASDWRITQSLKANKRLEYIQVNKDGSVSTCFATTCLGGNQPVILPAGALADKATTYPIWFKGASTAPFYVKFTFDDGAGTLKDHFEKITLSPDFKIEPRNGATGAKDFSTFYCIEYNQTNKVKCREDVLVTVKDVPLPTDSQFIIDGNKYIGVSITNSGKGMLKTSDINKATLKLNYTISGDAGKYVRTFTADQLKTFWYNTYGSNLVSAAACVDQKENNSLGICYSTNRNKTDLNQSTHDKGLNNKDQQLPGTILTLPGPGGEVTANYFYIPRSELTGEASKDFKNKTVTSAELVTAAGTVSTK